MLETSEKVLRIESMRDKVSPAEWKARVDLAAGYRLMELYGMSDMGANHLSLRVPGEPNHFLINPYGMLYEEMTASSMIKIDHHCNIIQKPDFGDFDFGVNRPGFIIHSAIHEAKPELDCVIHTHTWPGMAVSSLECGLLPLTQTAMRFTNISYHDFNGVVLDLAEQELLVRNMGDNNAMILRNHGLLTVGRTIAEAFNAMHRLELSCKAQLATLACNMPLSKVSDEILQDTFMKYQPKTRRPYGVMEWPALLRKLDRMDPSYRS